MCGISEFEENEKKCVYFVHNCLQFLQLYSFTYTTYKPSHRSHTIIPLSNHHTIIILKSHNLRNIYLSLVRPPRVRSLSSARVTRARLRMLSSSKSRLNCEFQWTILDKFLVIIAGKNSRERQKKERYKKTTREKPLSESVFKKHHHDL